MARRGTIAAINQIRGMVAIDREDDGYTIIELLSEWDIEVGDVIEWTHEYGLGSEVYRNATKGTTETVYVQNHAVQESGLRQQLLL